MGCIAEDDLGSIGSTQAGELVRNISEMFKETDLIIAAADTTSNSLRWILYCLAKHPDVQSKVYDEIMNSSSRGKIDCTDRYQKFFLSSRSC